MKPMNFFKSPNSAKLKAGDIVEVLSFQQILKTLDENGQLDNLPFMPEMKKFCGKRFKVYERVNIACIDEIGIGRFKRTITLENIRCDGSDHSGCQKSCYILWKVDWLKRCESAVVGVEDPLNDIDYYYEFRTYDVETRQFTCQASSLPYSTVSLSPIARIPYLIKELFSGNRKVFKFIIDFFHFIMLRVFHRSNTPGCHVLKGELSKTPTIKLDLQAEDLVEIKSFEEIVKTLDKNGKNRGLFFTPEMSNFCGKRFRVKSRLDKLISDKTGQMLDIKNTVLLDESVCEGVCSGFGCTRHLYHYWREIWLKKI